MGDYGSVERASHEARIVDRDDPWPGLAAFREADHEFFHGRELATAALYELVTRERVSVLYGASGLGKTSLLRAGLFPCLRREPLLPVYIRLGFREGADDPIRQVWDAMLSEASSRRIEAPPRGDSSTLWEYLYRRDAFWWSERHQIVTPLLVFDQFEEIFTLGRLNDARISSSERFLQDLAGLILGRPPDTVGERCQRDPDEALRYSMTRPTTKVLFSFREDFLPDFSALRGRLPGIDQHQCRLVGMSPEDARRVVTGAGGHLVAPGVADRIVAFVAAAGSQSPAEQALTVEPALLSVFCRELNNERRRLGLDRITADLVEDQQAAILVNFYERSLDGLAPGVRAFIEDHLILPRSGVRTSIAEEAALSHPGVTAETIDHLIERRLLRREERGGPALLELTHDILADPARQSRDRRRAEEQLRRQREMEEEARRELAREAERQRKELELRTAQAEAQAERVRANAERRMRRALFWSAAVLLAGFAVAVVAAVVARRSERAVHFGVVWTGYEQQLAAGVADEALLYLARAASLDPSSADARERLVALLLNSTWPLPVAVLRHDAPVRLARFTDDGTAIFAVTDDGGALALSLWRVGHADDMVERIPLERRARFLQIDEQGRRVLTLTGGTAEIWDARAVAGGGNAPLASRPVSPATTTAAVAWREGEWVGAGDDRGWLRLWSPSDPGDPAWERQAHDGPVEKLQFSPDGTRLFSGAAGGAARLWDSATGRELARLDGHENDITSVQFAPDGLHLVTASVDHTARVWRIPERPGTVTADVILRHDGAVRTAEFAPDGGWVVSASDDTTARVWNLGTRSVLRPEPAAVLQHDAPVRLASFSSDGTRIVTGTYDRAAVWDAGSGRRLTAPIQDSSINWVAWSPDTERVVTASEDRTVTVWDVRPGVAVASGSSDGEDAGLSALTSRDVPNVVRLAEVVSGYEVAIQPFWQRVVTHVLDPGQSHDGLHGKQRLENRVDELRRARQRFADRRRGSSLPSERLGAWVLDDRWARAIAPFSPVSVGEFVRDGLGKGDQARREVEAWYPGHPDLRGVSRGLPAEDADGEGDPRGLRPAPTSGERR